MKNCKDCKIIIPDGNTTGFCGKCYSKTYYKKHIIRLREYHRKHNKLPHVIERHKAFQQTTKYKGYHNEYQRALRMLAKKHSTEFKKIFNLLRNG